MPTRSGLCVYCGVRPAVSDDHVPPRALCAKPRPSDLVVVPSCKPCNEGASKDDEYFKTVLVLKDKAGNHPEALAVRDSVFRGLAKPRKIRFTRRLLAGVRDVSIRTEAGLHLGRSAAFDVDLTRLDRVVARVTRGLYWHHHNHVRLPHDHEVVTWSEEGLRGIARQAAQRMRRVLIEPVLANPPDLIGRGVLRYWHAASDREHVTGWLLEFYGDVRFLAFTVPKIASADQKPRGAIGAIKGAIASD